jgi:ABC-type hemin transport system ATPase subunit
VSRADELTSHNARGCVGGRRASHQRLEVIRALADYAAAVVLVSHDRRLRASFEGRRLEMAGGQVVDEA